MQLLLRLNSPWARCPNGADSSRRRGTKLDEQPGHDGPGPPTAAAAMHEDSPASTKHTSQRRPAGQPTDLEPLVWGLDVDDRQVVPINTPTADFGSEFWDAQHFEFVVLDQGDHRLSLPAAQRHGPDDDGRISR